MRYIKILFFLMLLAFSNFAHALYTELGLSYNYMNRTFDDKNKIESQGTTFSASFFIWERVALEASYTDSLYVKKEQQVSVDDSTIRTTTQKSGIYEGNLIYVFADRKATLQPYVKGGAAYITKSQVTQIGNQPPFEVKPDPSWAPSYGVGAKILLTDSFAIKLSYDVVQTPIDNSSSANDITARAGVTWIF